MNSYDVVVIGAGAAGLMCAMTAARRGRSVIVLDSANKVGKKILMSGGGKCNFTNLYVEPENYISHNPHYFKSALNQYTQWDFITMVNEHGIDYEERKHGQLFCLHSAKDILDMLLDECEKVGVEIRAHCEIMSIEKQDGYTVDSVKGCYSAESLVIATGALSIPTMGSSGFGYDIAQQFGLRVLPRRAGLVPFTFTDSMKGLCETLSGIALEVEMTCGKIHFTENMLFTHRGLSGPVVLQVSNYWQEGQAITVNLLPGQDLHEQIKTAKEKGSQSILRNFLSQFLPKNLVLVLQNRYWPEYSERPLAECPDKLVVQVSELIHSWSLKPSGTEGYRTAEVTLGGIDTDALSSKTMECKTQQGLYFIGEVVDVTGHLGGFNFQWAWSSGFVAGSNC